MNALHELLGQPADFSPLEIKVLLVNLLVGVVLASMLRWHYIHHGRALANREIFAANFVTLALAVTLVISIVKTSLALSLGLVGALSIVRFRTPIKDPEELTYLFVVIAVGLGLGASQTFATVVAFVFILVILSLRAWQRDRPGPQTLYLEVDVPDGSPAATLLEKLSALLVARMKQVNLERFDTHEDSVLVSFNLRCEDGTTLARVTEDIQREWPRARVTFLDAGQVSGG
jgi:hypothetical protein